MHIYYVICDVFLNYAERFSLCQQNINQIGEILPSPLHHVAYRSVLHGSIVYTYFQIVDGHGWVSESVHYYRLCKRRVQHLCCSPCSLSAICQLMYFPFRQMECAKHFIPRPRTSQIYAPLFTSTLLYPLLKLSLLSIVSSRLSVQKSVLVSGFPVIHSWAYTPVPLPCSAGISPR